MGAKGRSPLVVTAWEVETFCSTGELPCLLSLVFCPRLLSPVSCPLRLSIVPRLLSHASVSCPPSPVPCLLSPFLVPPIFRAFHAVRAPAVASYEHGVERKSRPKTPANCCNRQLECAITSQAPIPTTSSCSATQWYTHRHYRIVNLRRVICDVGCGLLRMHWISTRSSRT